MTPPRRCLNTSIVKLNDLWKRPIKTLATKDDLYLVKDDLQREMGIVRKEISESKADTIKWMFIFWIGQIGATLAIVLLFLKK